MTFKTLLQVIIQERHGMFSTIPKKKHKNKAKKTLWVLSQVPTVRNR